MSKFAKHVQEMIPSKAAVVFLLLVAVIYPIDSYAEEPCVVCMDSMDGIVYGATEAPDPTEYFVSTDGNNGNAGTENSPFKTIKRAVDVVNALAAEVPCKIWVKAGVYKDEPILSFKNNVVIEGYLENTGDINETHWEDDNYYTLGAALTDARMPVIDGLKSNGEYRSKGDNTIAFVLAAGRSNVVLRNLQIKNYTEGGIRTYGVDHATFENIYIDSTRSQEGVHSGGSGLQSVGNNCKLNYCVVVNSWGNNIVINGNNNNAQNCTSACLENATDNGTDYYFLTNGDHNLVESCEITRRHNGLHGGHGFMTQIGNCNQFFDCKSTGVTEAVQLIALKGSTEKNCFTRLEVDTGSIILSTQAKDNDFKDCDVVRGGVAFWRSYPLQINSNGHEIFGYAASNNNFYECSFRESTHCIDFTYGPDRYPWVEPAKDNGFFGCTFSDSDVLVRTARPNTGTTFVNSTFSKIINYHSDEGTTLDDTNFDVVYEPFDNPEFSNCEFIDNGFFSPPGTGNTTTNNEPRFPPRGDIYSGLVTHFKFDGLSGTETYDSCGGVIGALQGDAALIDHGKLGRCLSLDGDGDFVNCGDVLDLVDEQVITMACWIKPDNSSTAYIVNKLGPGGAYFLNINVDSRVVAFTRGPDGERQHATYKTKLPNNEWYHIAVVLDSINNKSYFYVNGILRETGGAILRGDTSNPFVIGTRSESYFKGCIDDLRIYNRELDKYDMKTLVDFRDPNGGLVGHWKFDDTDTSEAAESANDDLDLTGDAIGDYSWEDGKIGGCIRLGENGGYVSIGNHLDLIDENITIAAWVKPESSNGAIVSKLGGGGYYFLLGGNQSRIGGFTRGPFGELQHVTSKIVPENVWSHVAVVFDSTNDQMHFYVNGIFCGSGAAAVRGSTTNSLLIGRYAGNYFKGCIDDLRIYDRELDKYEMRTLAEFRDSNAGLVGHWKFDDTDTSEAAESANDDLDLTGDAIGDYSWEDGKIGGCIRLGENGGYVSVGDHLNLIDENITIAAWVKPESSNGAIVSKLGGGGYYFLLGGNQSRIGGFTRGPFGELQHVTSKIVPENVWSHVGVVFDSTNDQMHFYVNGIFCGSGAAAVRGSTTNSLLIGRYFGNYFKGCIDDLRIYNRDLDKEDFDSLLGSN